MSPENFNFYLLEEVDNNLLDEKEIFWIANKDSYYHGYNSTKGGEHFRGEFSNNELRKQKISEWSKSFWDNEENRKKLIEKRIGKKRSEFTKKQMSESAKKSWTEERKKKASESGNYVRHFDEETKKSVSIMQKILKKVDPKEIEEFIYTHENVKDVQVIGVPDEQYGEEIMACIILKEGMSMTVEEMAEYIGRLAEIAKPYHLRIEGPMDAEEREAQMIALKEMGCDIAQGYYFSKPVPAASRMAPTFLQL